MKDEAISEAPTPVTEETPLPKPKHKWVHIIALQMKSGEGVSHIRFKDKASMNAAYENLKAYFGTGNDVEVVAQHGRVMVAMAYIAMMGAISEKREYWPS